MSVSDMLSCGGLDASNSAAEAKLKLRLKRLPCQQLIDCLKSCIVGNRAVFQLFESFRVVESEVRTLKTQKLTI